MTDLKKHFSFTLDLGRVIEQALAFYIALALAAGTLDISFLQTIVQK